MADMDKLARERISTEIYTNFFVEAGAGSGKTTQLVQRMTAMVRSGIEVGKISAITFTKAAAREFYERFQKELISISGDDTIDMKERVRCAEALRNIDLCFMGTIDSFSHLILHEHPAEGQIPSDSVVKSEEEMNAIYRREYSSILRREYGDELFEKYRRFRSVHNQPDEVFASFIPTIIEARTAHINYEMPDNPDIERQFSEELAAVRNALSCLYNNMDKLGESADACRKSKELLNQKYEMLSRPWSDNIDNVCYILGKLKDIRLMCTPNEIGILSDSLFEPYAVKGKVKYYTFNITETDLFRELSELKYSFTMDFFVSAANAISYRLRKNGELTFLDYKLYLRDMLKKDAENGGKLIKHIYERHSYFLIDEFQDTDPMQAEIFFYLTAEEPVSDWRKCVPRKGSLFIVGDPKQSIYRFRSADVAAFKEVRSLFESGVGDVVQLTRNFRSTVKLKEWFNHIFSEILPADTPHQSKFSPIPVEGADDSSLFGGIWSYDVQMSGNSIADDEIQVTRIIRALVNDKTKFIRGKNDPSARNIRYSDFMVIVNSKDHIIKFLREFERFNIPVKVEGKISFKDCPSLSALIPVMEAVSSPDDRMPLYGALKSKVFGISDSELIRLSNTGAYLTVRSSDSELTEFPSISSALKTLRLLSNKAKAMTPVMLFNTIIDELRVLEKTGTAYLEYLYYALELLRDAEKQNEVVSISDGAAFLSKLLDESAQERCISLQRNENRVHIANLHKVKGLEAPIVILADPRTMPHKPDKRTEHNAYGSVCYIFNLSKDRIKKAETNRYQAAFADEETSMDAEKKRLLYVAATRARNALIIGETISGSTGARATNNPWEALLDSVEGNITNEITISDDEPEVRKAVNAAELYDEAERNSLLNDTMSTVPTYSIIRPSQIKLSSVIDTESDFEDNDDSEVRKKEIRTNAALVGTIVHKLMECVVSAKAYPDPDKLASEIVDKYNAPDECVGVLKGVFERITNGGYKQSNGMCDDILSELKTADEIHCEVPFCHKTVNEFGVSELWNGVIDLLYRKNGKWHIVDYKTNAEAEELENKYSNQLNAYKSALFSIIGEEADAAIYHIDV